MPIPAKRKDRRKLTAVQRQDIARQGGKALWAKIRKEWSNGQPLARKKPA